jgi:hypothetical protein
MTSVRECRGSPKCDGAVQARAEHYSKAQSKKKVFDTTNIKRILFRRACAGGFFGRFMIEQTGFRADSLPAEEKLQ